MMLARPVYGDNRSVLGVVAKELSLKPLREYLQALSIDRHGLAFVAESNGNLVVSSNGDGVFGASLSEPGKKVRFNVQDAGSSLMQQSWKLVQKYLQQHPDTEAVGDSAGSPGASLDQPRRGCN
ncbi:cache domain-containing protein [Collimonas sp.]|jgi:hypothetical protein|uniref:cache domain-containing protein n=1 Tax=Collimonas sp. TaxID=1963772 RepID=UPI0037C17686